MKKTVCVDLDGVLADYSKGFRGLNIIGDPLPGARDFMVSLKESYRVVVYTTRCKTFPEGAPGPEGQPEVNRSSQEVIVKFVTDWLQKWDIPHDEVYAGQGKPFAIAYVDDRAVSCEPMLNDPEAEFSSALTRIKRLCNG